MRVELGPFFFSWSVQLFIVCQDQIDLQFHSVEKWELDAVVRDGTGDPLSGSSGIALSPCSRWRPECQMLMRSRASLGDYVALLMKAQKFAERSIHM